MKTIKSIKTWVRNEEKRLEQRILEQNTQQELSSLQGSLITIRKIKEYLKEK